MKVEQTMNWLRARAMRLAFYVDAGTGDAGSSGAGGSTGSGGSGDASTGSASMGSTSMGSTGNTVTSSAGSTGSFAWGNGWREQLAAGDAKVLQRLGRFNSPEDVWRSYSALEARFSSGEFKSVLKPGATEAEMAAWRKENGVPEKPTDYDLKFDDGTVIGQEDMPTVSKFLEVAHKNNLTPTQVKDTLQWYYTMAEAQTEERSVQDTEAARKAQDELRAKWGNDYRPNINSVHSLLDQAPAGFKDLFLNGRLSDGTPIGSSVGGLEWLANLSRIVNPAGTVVPAGTTNIGQAIGDELAKLTKMMGNRNSEYWKGPKADANQARYRELVDAKNRQELQTAGARK